MFYDENVLNIFAIQTFPFIPEISCPVVNNHPVYSEMEVDGLAYISRQDHDRGTVDIQAVIIGSGYRGPLVDNLHPMPVVDTFSDGNNHRFI